jgi:aminopeptidase N
MRLFFVIITLLFQAIFLTTMEAAELAKEQNYSPLITIHHDLKVVLHPEKHSFIAEDTITLSEDRPSKLFFRLHKGLNPSSSTNGVSLAKETGETEDVFFDTYRITLPKGVTIAVLRYGGIIDHPVMQYGKEQARGYSHTPGLISAEGAYLAGSSYWYPVFDGPFVTFQINAELPSGWDAVSQGVRVQHDKDEQRTTVRWESPEPQEEIFLVAAKFVEYNKSAGDVTAMVFLRTPDQALAAKYLDATVSYITMYEKLIGSYPYKKFALVENFYETGFGMPSFTLLGTKVIRLPFIINSSYPHEILHNWWGNSVFPDYEKGNWSEGLTAYLSDHLLKEQQGEGAEYRQAVLQKYTDYVSEERDFPLTAFRSRHSSSSEAIGYGKSLMFFHILRQELGDTVFIEGLRDFYRKNIYRFATFTDLQKSFERVSRKDLQATFDQWITQAGAPELKISDVVVAGQNEEYSVIATFEQKQVGKAYRLRIPVAITREGNEEAFQAVADIDEKKQATQFTLPARPLRIDVDPEFDLFRRLDREEIPPAISQALGAKKMLVILPSSADKTLLQSYRNLAKALGQSGPDEVEVALDTELSQLPGNRSVAIIGWENRFFHLIISSVASYEVRIDEKNMHIGKSEFPLKNHSVVLTVRNAENRDMAIMFIASDLPGALPGLSRKLPHYHKYSYLIFEGSEPANIGKGRWPVLFSPMTVLLPDEQGNIVRPEMGRLARRNPLISLPQRFSEEKMLETIRYLSGDDLNGRGLGTTELDRAAEYIAQQFRNAGLAPAGNEADSYFQTWEEQDTGNPGHMIKMTNVIGVIPGHKPEWEKQSIVIGAHYDHLGQGSLGARKENKGKIHVGADDNASGVAVLIELARVLAKDMKPARNIVFVAFTGEEEGKKGSKYYTAHEKGYPVQQSVGMLNLDTVGRMQKNRLLILGAGSAGEWVHIFRGAGYLAGVEIEAVTEELDSSDQKSFQEAGVPAVQLFTGPHEDYHSPADTIEKINPAGLVKVASVVKEAVEYLVQREQPLTLTAGSVMRTGTETKGERKVTFGIIPDFTYEGKGCKVSEVVQGSPAEASGMKEGDIIIRINGTDVQRLKDLSDILKSLKPGEKISVVFMRSKTEMTVRAVVVER